MFGLSLAYRHHACRATILHRTPVAEHVETLPRTTHGHGLIHRRPPVVLLELRRNPLSPALSQPDLQWPNSGLHRLPWSLSSNGGSATPELLRFFFFSSSSSGSSLVVRFSFFSLSLLTNTFFFSVCLRQSFHFLASFLRTFLSPSVKYSPDSKTSVAFSAF